MARKRSHPKANPDLRRRTQVPAPAIAEIEQRLQESLTPESFKSFSGVQGTHQKALRNRALTLPVMVALVLSLVYRQIGSLSELLRVVAQQGVLWVAPMQVSVEALSKRLRVVPVRLFCELFQQVMPGLRRSERPPSALWQALSEQFRTIWIADGSTLEALHCHLKTLRQEPGSVLAGKMMGVIELLTHHPVALRYSANPNANDRTFEEWLLATLPVGGLLVFDLGFFKFLWFDQFTQQQKYFLTRLREKTRCQVTQVLWEGPRYRDQWVHLGQDCRYRCQSPLRLVSVLWDGQWYQYLTNVLDPQQLPPHLVCELYRRRWRIEDAFAITKRVLGLSYLWVGAQNGVQIQIYTTWIFYALLNDLCSEVAVALQQPLEWISVEMVFRGTYHYAQALLKGCQQTLVQFLVQHHKLLALVKPQRQRHCKRDEQFQDVWGIPALS